MQSLPLQTRVITYAYDGLQRLTDAHESPGSTYAYAYDLAGNRTDGGTTYNAANQVVGLTYDNAGNLTNDGTAASTYDALGRMTARGGTTYTSNGDGVLVYDGTTRYTQDLAAPLTQILQTTQGSATTDYLYGRDRLAAVTGSNRTWYGTDALGSVRQTISDTGVPLGIVNYDPWGTVESGSVPRFGFTGELQDSASGLVNLRARWYSTAQGRFTSVDPFAGMPETPYSQHQYQYGYSDPVLNTDPSGRFIHCTFAPSQSIPITCRLWTWEEWTHTGSQVREDVAQSPKTPLISGLADLSLIGSAKGVIEGITGEDLLTRRPLPWWQRGLGLLCLGELRGLGRFGAVAEALEEGEGALSRVGRLGVVADALEEGESALPTAATGFLGGKLYGKQRLAALSQYLYRRGVDLLVGDEFLPPSAAGGFRVLTSGRPQLVLRSNPTEYQVWHELSHYIQYRSIGPEAYGALPRNEVRNAAEQFVFDMLERSRRWSLLSPEEQQHAIDYIERVDGGGFR